MTHYNIVFSDVLFRNVSSKPQFWKPVEGKPSSAIFKDSKGVSVDRQKERDTSEVIDDIKSKFTDTYAIITVSTDDCSNANVVVLDKPLENNPFHAEIHKSSTEIQLSSAQARRLAKACKVVFKK